MNPNLNCILIVDDDEPTNFLTKMLLEETGCSRHLKFVQSGYEALDYLVNSEQAGADPDIFPSPDLILLDINMPAMNGWEFLENYKELGILNKVVIVMLTTSLFPEDKIKAEQVPEISGFEHKPLTIENLKRILDRWEPSTT